ncbi:hypothetical protein [Streptomyces flavofungini]|uniref:hypothetical protein n=1 Tax=Streptomyces flavofungini TaxID=68200 RepID=UPI0034DF59B0
MSDTPRPRDALYDRYMKAAAARRAHSATCTQCSPDAPRCEDGQHLEAEFKRFQDAYLARLRKQR